MQCEAVRFCLTVTGWPPADDNNHIMVVVTVIGSGSLGSRVAGEGLEMMMMMGLSSYFSPR